MGIRIDTNMTAATELRLRAEEQQKVNRAETGYPLSAIESQRLLHELQVHQIELEMQNAELRQARNELDTALDKYTGLYDFAPVAYFTLDRTGAVTEVNLAGASLVGGVRSRLIGQQFGKFVADAERIAFNGFLERVLASLVKESCEFVLVNKLKQRVIVQIEAMATASGQEFRLALIDVTGRKNMEAHILQAEKMETVVLLAGGIAQDINTILHKIVGYSACSEMSMKADDPLRVNLDQIMAAADRGANLTRSLLNFSRMQPANPLPVNINEIVRNVDTFLTMVIGEDINFETTFSAGVLTVTADSGQLEQVLISLATNARNAMPDGGRLSISTESVVIDSEFIRSHGLGAPGKYALISVTDNGIGMNRETTRKIFEPFFTSDVNSKGAGLGLSAVYNTIRRHNGLIVVSSELQKGTTFRIYLPLSDAGPGQD
jgi:PAS domain S-box-containing protein